MYGVHAPRDTSELGLTRDAIERGMPVLAICRGHQVLNVALGRTLDQHIPDRDGVEEHGTPGKLGGARVHDVDIDARHPQLRGEPGDSLAEPADTGHRGQLGGGDEDPHGGPS